MTNQTLRTRRSILDIQNDFESGKDTKTLEDLMTAWAGIQALDPADPHSFFVLGGYHGEPFRGAGYGNSQWWGGWCNHGNVLFPTWHRIYLYKLEQALQSIPGCENVMLPYWDETDAYSLKNGIPSCLTDQYFTYSNGAKIPNPLVSFTFPVPVTDNVSSDNGVYTKPLAYTTMRFPYSGLVGTDDDAAASKIHNENWPTLAEGNVKLNQNVIGWLTNEVIVIPPDNVNVNKDNSINAGILNAFQHCLEAPNYTVFSNTTSRQHHNDLLPNGPAAVALEDPHNDIHLAVGGFDITNVPGVNGNASPITGANGDMGENDTAGLDPIFYFHHCNVDRMFWVWQKKTGNLNTLDIIPEYPGTNSVDSQGPTPGVAGNVWLSMDSPLMPFVDQGGKTYTSRDAVNIEQQLGYTYAIGSLDQAQWPPVAGNLLAARTAADGYSDKILRVSGVNKGAVSGSFLIAAHATVNGEKHLIGVQSVLSRHAIQGCANCQTHLNVKAHFNLAHLPASIVADPKVTFSADLITHKARNGGSKFFGLLQASAPDHKPLTVAIK